MSPKVRGFCNVPAAGQDSNGYHMISSGLPLHSPWSQEGQSC